MTKSTVIFMGKLLIGLALIALLLQSVDMTRMAHMIVDIDKYYLLLAFISPHIAMFLAALKWKRFLDLLGICISSLKLFCLYMIGAFFNNFLPSMMGGDAVKGYALYRETGQADKILASTFMDRFVGLAALITFLPLMLWQDNIVQEIPLLTIILIAIFVAYMVLLLLVFSPIFYWLEKFPVSNKWLLKVLSFIKESHDAVRFFRSHKTALLQTYGISLVFYVFTIATPWLVAKSLGLYVDYIYLAAFVPMVMLVAMIPISPNGLGIAEAGYTLFLQLAGLSLEEALAIALILRMRLIVTGLIGGLIFIQYKTDKNTTPLVSG